MGVPSLKSAHIIFDVALRTIEKLDSKARDHVEVIKIDYVTGRNAPSPHTIGCMVWTCVLNLNGKKTVVQLQRSSFFSILHESDDLSEALDLDHPEDYVEKASDEFAGFIKESGRQIAESILQEARVVCDRFDVEY